MAARSVMSLDVHLGLFGFPVAVYKATDETDTIGFRQLHDACHTPIHVKRHCAACDVEVEYHHIVKGFETKPNTYVTITDDELKALKPERTGMIDIAGYVDSVPPDMFDGTMYYLRPSGKDAKATAFVTWRDALGSRWALGRVVMYGRERVVAIRPYGRVLALHYLRTVSQIRELSQAVANYEGVPAQATAPAEHLALMRQVIERKGITLSDVVIERDRYVEAIEALVESKKTGEPMAAAEPAVAPAVVDLLAALQAELGTKVA